MARRVISLDEKIEKAQVAVVSAKEKYDSAVAALENLLSKRREIESKELLKAFAASERSYDEVMAFLKSSKSEKTIES